jgi:Sec-independent protein translocase protein TatA
MNNIGISEWIVIVVAAIVLIPSFRKLVFSIFKPLKK